MEVRRTEYPSHLEQLTPADHRADLPVTWLRPGLRQANRPHVVRERDGVLQAQQRDVVEVAGVNVARMKRHVTHGNQLLVRRA